MASATVADSGPLTLRVSKPAGNRAVYMGQYTPPTELTPIPGDGADTVLVTVPNVKAWSVGTVFFED